jgi:hypothetical protein
MRGRSFRTSGVILVLVKKSRDPPFQACDSARCDGVEGMLEQLALNACRQTIPLQEHGRTEALEDMCLLLGQEGL